MSVGSDNSRNDYVGNGSTDTYDYTFRIISDTDLRVTVRDTDDVESTLVLTTDYTVSGAGDEGGGSITLVDGDLASGYTITIRRVRPLTQETDIRNQGDYYPESLEDALDHCIMVDQQQQDELDRSLKLPESVDPVTVSAILPAPVALQGFRWNADGDGIESFDFADSGVIAAPGGNGITVYTGSNTFIERVLTGSSSVTVTNGSGVSGNPTFEVPTGGISRAMLAALAASTRTVVSKTFANSPYTVAATDEVILVNASGGAVTVNLPAAASFSGRVLAIKKTDSSANVVTIDGNASETIEGALTRKLTFQYDRIQIASDGTNWFSLLPEQNVIVKAEHTSSSAIAAGTVINWNSVVLDRKGYITTGASWKFQPLEPGFYKCYAQMYGTVASAVHLGLAFWKTGTIHSQDRAYYHNGSEYTLKHQDVIELNGTTDYVDVRLENQGVTPTANLTQDRHYFIAEKVA
jgi:hypothetical protein